MASIVFVPLVANIIALIVFSTQGRWRAFLYTLILGLVSAVSAALSVFLFVECMGRDGCDYDEHPSVLIVTLAIFSIICQVIWVAVVLLAWRNP